MNLLNGRVRVLNYDLSPVGFPSTINSKGNFVEARDEDEEYKMERVLWEDVELENNKSDLFKVGRLRFLPEEEDEIYKKLGIEDRENINTDKELIAILMDDSIENLKKLSKIKSMLFINRIKKMLFKLEKVNKIPPHNVIAVINERYDQLKGYRRNENSVIARIVETEKRNNNDENKLKDTLLELTKKVEKLETEKANTEQQSQNALTDLLKIVQDLKAENEALKQNKIMEESKDTVVEDKKVGRPKQDTKK